MDPIRGSLATAAVVSMLAGCGGGLVSAPSALLQQTNEQSRLGPPVDVMVDASKTGAARSGMLAVHPNLSPSWMAPGAAKQTLLYVSNYGDADVFVYSYPQGKLVGTLTGFYGPDGICSDKKGDVWIVNNYTTQSGENVVEYKHGGTQPIATVYDPAYAPTGCSVDPVTGNLAVANFSSWSSAPGNLALFKHASGSPQLITIPHMSNVYFCGYDPKGNLYVDGTQTGPSSTFQFAELARGKKTFKDIKLKGGTISFPGNIRWDGKHVAVGDQEYQFYPEISAIYQTTGAGGKIVGKTIFKEYGDIDGFSIDGNTVIGPNNCQNGCTAGYNVGFYKYPAGGGPFKKLTNKNFNEPLGSALSP